MSIGEFEAALETAVGSLGNIGSTTFPQDPQFATASSPCNDNNECTNNDKLVNGICQGTLVVICEALDQCHIPGVCNPDTGLCSDPPKEDGETCDDGDACTLIDSCQGGFCDSVGILNCNDDDACTFDSCDPSLGCIYSDVSCADGVDCTVDSCDSQNGCSNTSDDSLCDDGNECTAGSCFPPLGCLINNVQDGTACSIGICLSGACVPLCTPEEEICFDGEDNDCDGFIDCEDIDCKAIPTCGGEP